MVDCIWIHPTMASMRGLSLPHILLKGSSSGPFQYIESNMLYFGNGGDDIYLGTCGSTMIMRLRLFSGGITQKVQLHMYHLWMFLFQMATHWKLLIGWMLRCILLKGNDFSLSYWSMRKIVIVCS